LDAGQGIFVSALAVNGGSSGRMFDNGQSEAAPLTTLLDVLERSCHANAQGTRTLGRNPQGGKGQVDLSNGLFKGAYSFASRFEEGAAAAKAGCPVSRALAGTEITLEARLVA
jgi:hypothetical protein